MKSRARVQLLAAAAAALALAGALTLPRAHAAAVAVSWSPVLGATGYRIEVASKAAGPWKLARDVPARPDGTGYRVASIDGLRARGAFCVRLRAYRDGAGWSDASPPVCGTLPRPAFALPAVAP